MNSEQALVWNMRTCCSDDKGYAQVVTPRGQSTDAERRGGLLRSSVEVLVMRMERRWQHVQFVSENQPVMG